MSLSTGRPKETTDNLPENWQDKIIDLYSYGASDVEIKAYLSEIRGSMSNDLWDRWMKEDPVFSETIKKGKLLSQRWWERNARMNLENKNFQAALWFMNMKNRFGWADKQEIKSEHSGNIDTNVKFSIIGVNANNTDSADNT